MKREDWQRAYGPLPEALSDRVSSTLLRLEKEETVMRRHTRRTAVAALAILLALAGVAYALIESKTADIFGWFYGAEKKENLLSGDIAQSGQSYTLGDVVYTLDEVIYKDGFLYGTGSIRAAEGANIVLMPEDYAVTEPAGYMLHYGDEVIPDGAPTYAGLARARDAKIILAKCVADGVVEADGTLNASEIGYFQLPQPDGTIRFTFEFQGRIGHNESYPVTQAQIDRAPTYDIQLYVANWEVTEDGEWLREAPRNTWLKAEWVVTVTPELKEE